VLPAALTYRYSPLRYYSTLAPFAAARRHTALHRTSSTAKWQPMLLHAAAATPRSHASEQYRNQPRLPLLRRTLQGVRIYCTVRSIKEISELQQQHATLRRMAMSLQQTVSRMLLVFTKSRDRRALANTISLILRVRVQVNAVMSLNLP
jgi:hypothetical protein